MAAESPNTVQKVVVHLRATGDAPILKQAKFKIAGNDKFAKVIDFLRRQLHRDTLFVYVNSAFAPNPDELVIDLYNVSCQLCDENHLAIQCPWMYSPCRVNNCHGIRKLLISKTSKNPNKKFLVCQFQKCGDFEWLDEAIGRTFTAGHKQHNECFKYGELGHWQHACPWDGSICVNVNCYGRRKLLSSKREGSSGKKFLKCSYCGSFEWLADALGSKKKKLAEEPTVSIEMTIKDLCKLSISKC